MRLAVLFIALTPAAALVAGPRAHLGAARALRRPSALARAAAAAGGDATPEFALLFDCDGVIVETEELHRLAYNGAFQQFDLTMADGEKVDWSVEYYDVLQNTVGGGKPKMK